MTPIEAARVSAAAVLPLLPLNGGSDVGILLIHGAGYQKDDSRRYLQRQRLRAGLIAGFVAAERIAVTDALNQGEEQVPFAIRMVEYSDALNRAPSEGERPPEVVPGSLPASEWAELPKLRCLCCKRTRASAPTSVIGLEAWSGTSAGSQTRSSRPGCRTSTDTSGAGHGRRLYLPPCATS